MEELHNDTQETQTENSAEPLQEQTQDSELISCITERNAWKEKYLRVQADLDNFSKRMDKERVQWKNLAQEAMLEDILPIIDDFDRAFAAPKEEHQDMQQWLAGFNMIRASFYKFLDKYDVKEIPASMPFDPEYHESLMQVDSPDHKSGEIVAILQKGFTFKGQVLRPAKVSIAK